MKKILLLLIPLFFLFTSCNKENETTTPPSVKTEYDITENITQNTTWKYGNIYFLKSRISVLNGVTLTIEPGVIIKGEAGTGSNATALIIARGGKIISEGTKEKPIIFTSSADLIKVGEIESPNLDHSLNGLWGGLIVLGFAPISADAVSVQIEGIPPSDQNGLYGGDNPNDNSGIIKYVSIRHGGTNIGEGNEINGLTLGGVGNQTIIENIEVVANQDDGIEWFGGTVNVKNVVVWEVGDDAIDTDQSWSGTLDNFIIYNPGDECMELDGPEGSLVDGHKILNGTVIAKNAQGLVDLDDNSIVEISKVYFYELQIGQDFDLYPSGLILSEIQSTIPSGTNVTDFFIKNTHQQVTIVNEKMNTVGCDISQFGWTWFYKEINL